MTLQEVRRRNVVALVASLALGVPAFVAVTAEYGVETSQAVDPLFVAVFATWMTLSYRGARTLRLDFSGLTLGPGPTVLWSDVQGFYEYQGRGRPVVAYHLRANGFAPAGRPDGTVPAVFLGMEAPALAEYLNRWRAGAGSVSR